MKGRSFDPKAFLSTNGLARTANEYPPNRKIFSQGDLGVAIFFIQKGKVRLTVVSKQGKEAIIGMLSPGDFLGESCLTGHTRHSASAETVAPSSILRIERHEMVRTLEKEAALSVLFISYLLSRNQRIEADLVDQLFNSTEKRLARVLLIMSGHGNKPKASRVIPRVSQVNLAQMVGVSRERANLYMNKFKRLGFIDYDYTGDVEIHDSLRGVVLHE